MVSMTIFLSQYFGFVQLKGSLRGFRTQSKGTRQVVEEKVRRREKEEKKITGPQMLPLLRFCFQ